MDSIRSDAMSPLKSPWDERWNQALSEYIRLVEPPPAYEQLLFGARSSANVVALAVASQPRKPAKRTSSTDAEKLFLAAVAAAGTHPNLVEGLSSLPGDKASHTLGSYMATFLRYADTIDKLLESLSNTSFPSAVLFAALRFMLSVAVQNMNLFNAIQTQFREFDARLRRIDVYLGIENPTGAVKSMLAQVLIDIIRFCGLATKYFKSIHSFGPWLTVGNKFRPSFNLKNQLEAVISDLDKDTMLEVASGVAQMNFGIEQIRTKIGVSRHDVG